MKRRTQTLLMEAPVRTLALILLVVGAFASTLRSDVALAAEPSDAALARIDRIMAEWAEHRAQTIRVKNIAGVEVSSLSKTTEQLEERLKSLLTKKRSNREWKGYWEGEAGFADKLLAAYAEVAPVKGKGLLDAALGTARAASDEATAAAAAATGKARVASDARDAARVELEQARDALAARIPVLDATLEGRKTAFAKASEPIVRLEARLEKAQAGDGEAEARAALDTAVAERDGAEAALTAAHEALLGARAVIAWTTAFLAAEEVGPVPAADAELEGRIAALVDARVALAAAQVEAKATAERAAEAAAKVQRIATLVQGFRARRPALEAWGALARDKMVNQDTYLSALDANIAAVEERLRGLRAAPTTEGMGSSQTVCETERKPDTTPLEKYEECSRATKEELRAVDAELSDVRASALLTQRTRDSIETLLAAQRNDVALVEREASVSSDEAKRAARADETAAWRQAWDTYAERASDKHGQLRDAVQVSKDTRRSMTVNLAFYASEQETLQKRLVSLQTELDERTAFDHLAAAVAGTAWYFIRHAYMVPVFLLLAWLALRAARRLSARIVAKAALEATHKDEVQRVETLAAVSRGAVRLVVYIATGLLCLEAVGVDTSPILGGAAIFGLAISFGSQSLVKDFVTGFFILLENQYAVGDVVAINGESGTVQAITMRRTVMRDLSGRVHNIPNGAVTNVINNTQGWSGVVIHIGVAYGSDLDLVEEVVNREGDAMFADPAWAGKLDEPPRYVGLTTFGDSALNVRITFKTQVFEQWAAERAFNRRLKDAFEAADIGIPFPQRDLHVISVPPGLPMAPAPAPEADAAGASPASEAGDA